MDIEVVSQHANAADVTTAQRGVPLQALQARAPTTIRPAAVDPLTAPRVATFIGWRIQLMVQLGREVPDLPGDLLFSDGELRVLATFARSRKLPPPARLGDAVGLVRASAGGSGAHATRPARS